MFTLLLVAGMLVCGIQAIRAQRLLTAALWLACVSALVSIILYRMGAYDVAAIELSVGAGLVTVLFVFAISIAGEGGMTADAVVPRWLSWSLMAVAVLLLGWLLLPVEQVAQPTAEASFSQTLWQARGLDVLVQIGLVFSAVLGVLGLLTEEKAGVAEETAVVAKLTSAAAQDESRLPQLANEPVGQPLSPAETPTAVAEEAS